MEGQIPELLKPISWIIGTWESKDGAGEYPTLANDFKYFDVLNFKLCGQQPLLAYSGSSSHPEKGNPMHLESGFLRARGEGRFSFMVAHNFGVVSIEEGNMSGKEMTLTSSKLGRMGGAKDPEVTQIQRKFILVDDNTLVQEMSMATSTTPVLTHHLRASYIRKH